MDIDSDLFDEDTRIAGTAPAPPKFVGHERGACIGRYVVLDQLGTGGMGVVYKAYDPELDRPVALKLLHAGGPDASFFRDRLLREAQGLARLSHPNVVAVHDVGQLDSQVFLAMEYIEGETLRLWGSREQRTHRQILDAYLAAGEGLAAAHRAGLVHRDFKPDNVIIGSDGRARVLDFGLVCAPGVDLGDHARIAGSTSEERPSLLERSQFRAVKTKAAPSAVEQPSVYESQHTLDRSPSLTNRLSVQLTQAGAVMGTPRYMAPEQHTGSHVDERADPFAFCVSLYAALYGAPPFAGDTPGELREAVLHGRISDAPAGSKVPSRLRAILIRGLATDPANRWPSMEELLAQLRKDPAAAWRRAAAICAVVVAVVVAAVAAGYAVHSRRVAAQEARLAQELGRTVAQIEATARIAAILPRHDLRAEVAQIRKLMSQIEAQMRELGQVATAPGHYALGRGYVALERWREALVELEAAQASGYRSEGLSYALGLTHGTLYQKAIEQLVRSDDATADANARAAIVKAHRTPALRHLNDARRAGASEVAGRGDYLRALIALYEEKFDQALLLSRKAASQDIGLFEARTLEGDVHVSLAADRAWKGDNDGELVALEAAGKAYGAALEVARSSAAALDGECRRLLKTAYNRYRISLSPEVPFKQAIEACARAAEVRPDDPTPLTLQVEAWTVLGTYQAEHGADPRPALDEAMRLGERALELDPKHVMTHDVLSGTNETLGSYLFRKGEDSRPAIDRAIKYARRAIELDPQRFSAYSSLGVALNDRALDDRRHGRDPRASYREAIECAQQQRKSFRGSERALVLLQVGYSDLGMWQRDHGIDPTEALQKAAAACKEARDATPKVATHYINLCYNLWILGNHQMRIGQDPQPALDEGIAACAQAAALTPEDWIPHLDLGVSRSTLARYRLQTGGDPTPFVEQARRDIQRSLAIDFNMVTLRYLGEVEQTAARWAALKGEDAAPLFAAAEAALSKVLAADGSDADGLRRMAELERYRAQWLLATHRPAASVLRAGLEHAERAVALEADLGEGHALAGALHLLAADAASTPEERIREASKAQAALKVALEMNGFLKREYAPLLEQAARLAQP